MHRDQQKALEQDGFSDDHYLPADLPVLPDIQNDISHRDKKFQTIYFSADIFIGPRSSMESVTTPSKAHENGESAQWVEDSGSNHNSDTSQEELDYVVEQLAKADYLPHLLKGFDHGDSGSDHSVSDRLDSPTLPSSTYSPSSMYSRSLHELDSSNPPSLTSDPSRSSVASLPGASFINYTGTMDDIERFSRRGDAKLEGRSGARDGSGLTLRELFDNLALTDPKVSGQPIRYTTQEFEPGTNSFKVGACTFLNLPYGAASECGLRIEPRFDPNIGKTCSAASGDLEQQVRLQVVQNIVHAKTGRQVMLLCSEVDVSDRFTPAVRRELSVSISKVSRHPVNVVSKRRVNTNLLQNVKYSPSPMTCGALEGDTLVASDLDDIAMTYRPRQDRNLPSHQHRQVPSTVPAMTNNADEDIWLNIAKSLAANNASTTTLPRATKMSDHLSSRMQALVCSLDEIKIKHRNFFVVRMSAKVSRSARNTATTRRGTFTVPWLSSGLYQRLLCGGKDALRSFKDAMAVELSREFAMHSSLEGSEDRNRLAPFLLRAQIPVGVLGPRADLEGGTEGHLEQAAYAMPMFEDAMAGRGGKSPACCWICFLVD